MTRREAVLRRLRGRPGVALGAAVLAAAIGGVPLAAWCGRVTGEESLPEALKGAVALMALRARERPADLAPLDAAADNDVRPYGVNTFLQLEAEPANVQRAVQLLADAGIAWIRQEFPWEDIEIHGPGDFEDRRHAPYRSAWDKYDLIVDAARAHGIEVLVRIDNPPDWAFADPAVSGEKGPPDDPLAFGRFAGAVAGRYCGRVRYYQLWNEPNIYPEWGERDVDPAGYAELLAVGAGAVRDACPGAAIVSAALAPTTEGGGRNLNDLAYLRALYAAGWQDDFDVLAVQGFGLWTGPTDRRASEDRTNFARITLARAIMVAHGDAAKPVWITEMGWTSPPASLDVPDRDKYGRASEEVRARYLREAYARMGDEWPWAGVGFVWMLRRPDWEWHTRPEGWFRLVEPDWQVTPAFRELSALAAEPLRLAWGRHLPTHPALTASGPWQPQEPPGRGIVGSVGAELVVPFRGPGYGLRVGTDQPFSALVVLDGVTGTVRAGAAGVTSSGRFGLTASGLEDAEHTAILRVDSGALSLEDIVIAGGPPRWWWPAVGPAAVLFVALILAIYSIAGLRSRP